MTDAHLKFIQWLNRYEVRSWIGLVREKYEKIGHTGGIVILTDISPQAKVGIAELLGKKPKLKGGGEWRISMAVLEKRFGDLFGLTISEALEIVYERPIITKQETRDKSYEEKQSRLALYLEVITELQENTQTEQNGYLNLLKDNLLSEGSKLLGYLENGVKRDTLKVRDVLNVIRAIGLLERGTKNTLLAPFALSVTGDPHSYDYGTPTGRLFLYILTQLFPDEDFNLNRVLDKDTLLSRAGLARDSLSSWVVLSGFHAYNSYGDEDPLLRVACEHGRYLMATLHDVCSWSKINSVRGSAFAVENGQVFEYLWEKTRRLPLEKRPSLLYAGGWFSAAALIFLDHYLIKDNMLFYSGDFEPGGLRIARYLLRRYGDRIKLWRMGEAEYQFALAKGLTTKHPRRWDSQSAELACKLISDTSFMKRTAQTRGYQESLKEILLSDITTLHSLNLDKESDIFDPGNPI